MMMKTSNKPGKATIINFYNHFLLNYVEKNSNLTIKISKTHLIKYLLPYYIDKNKMLTTWISNRHLIKHLTCAKIFQNCKPNIHVKSSIDIQIFPNHDFLDKNE